MHHDAPTSAPRVLVLAVLLALAWPHPASARPPEPSDESDAVADTVVARVGERELTLGELMLRWATLPQAVRLGYGERMEDFLRDTVAHLAITRAAEDAFAERVGADFQAAPTIVAKKDGDLSTLAMRISDDRLREHLAASFGGPASGCHVGRMDPDDARHDGPMCAAASRYCNITSSGDVMACNILPGSGGNLRETSFREIWEGSRWLNEVRSIRREALHTCKDCDRLAYCGRCHAMALVEDGDLYGPSTFAQRQAELLEELAADAPRS